MFVGYSTCNTTFECYALIYEVRNWREVKTTLLCMSTTIEQDPKVGENLHLYIGINTLYMQLLSKQVLIR